MRSIIEEKLRRLRALILYVDGVELWSLSDPGGFSTLRAALMWWDDAKTALLTKLEHFLSGRRERH
jgi:hypothetical protein